MIDTTHYAAHLDGLATILLRLSNERIRLANAKTKNERTIRAVWVSQIEKEASEIQKLITEIEGYDTSDPIGATMTDDELIAALFDSP